MDVMQEYGMLIAALAIGVVYLLFIRPRLKGKIARGKGTVYVCHLCGDHDCTCHKLDKAED